MSALISIFLANLPALIKAGSSLVSYIASTKAALSQDTEWTADHEQHYQDQLVNDGNLPQWKTDAELGQ